MGKSGARKTPSNKLTSAERARTKPGVKTSTPAGPNPPGSTRPVREQPNRRAATDVPIEVPVYVCYDRHIREGSGELLGWTVTVDLLTFEEKVEIKIVRKPHKTEVWFGGTLVGSSRSQPNIAKSLPNIAKSLPKTAPNSYRADDEDEEWEDV